jgi:hypothetical protein
VFRRKDSAALRASWACACWKLASSTIAGTGRAIHSSRSLRARRIAALVFGPPSLRGFRAGLTDLEYRHIMQLKVARAERDSDVGEIA